MFPLSRLYEILDELHRYQVDMARNTPTYSAAPDDREEFTEYVDLIYRYSRSVYQFSEVIKLLHSYNNKRYSNYNPNVEGFNLDYQEEID